MASLIVAEITGSGGNASGMMSPLRREEGRGGDHRDGDGDGDGDGGGSGWGSTASAAVLSEDVRAVGARVGGVFSTAVLAVGGLFLLGTLSYMALEGLSLVDAAYLTTGVITTVGLVIVPRTAAGRAFTALFNVASLGLGVLLLTEIAEWRRAWTRGVLRQFVPAPTGTGPRAMQAMLWLEVAALAAAAVPTCLGAAVVFHVLEGWSLPESLYFALITGSGLGMGDVEPRQWTTRIVFVLYMWLIMGVMLGLLGTLGHMAHEALSHMRGHGMWLTKVGGGSPLTPDGNASVGGQGRAPPARHKLAFSIEDGADDSNRL